MSDGMTLKIFITIVLIGFCLNTTVAQSNGLTASEHFERAESFSAEGDARAEEEYKQAIAKRGGIYPEAWERLSRHLSNRLRFEESVVAWRKYLKQSGKKASTANDYLNRLERTALLKSRTDKGQSLSIEERLELTKLVAGFGSPEDAVPYAERAVDLYPQSARALVALAELIRREQQSRALELLTRAIAFEPRDDSIYVVRGSLYFWTTGDLAAAEADFRTAIELSKGSNASAWAGLGDSLAREGRRDEAIAAYRHYLSIRPKSAAHYDGEIRKSIELLKKSGSNP